ncbi:hypothetical protein TEA_016170 [Camellia sinensis var. sinensis]|uniref:Protein kinase domain-containing protein n=1 Tax=Camellia sinensis var. sinensis TaxID=542762 RepID=A0A4V3WQ36_CAMSN|nr:hypothetical protein TEA_016170 [Camellia sinensis var. sinensis]
MKSIICTDRTCPSPFNYNFNFNFMPPVASAARVVAKAPRKSIFAAASVNGNGNSINGNGRRRILTTTTSSPPTPTTSNGTATIELEMPSSGAANSALEQLDFERGVCVPFRKYSPEMVRSKVLESRGAILSLMARGIEIVWNLGFYWSTLIFDFWVGRDEEVVPYRARQLRNLLCDLGPSFIKAGQVLANRPDIIREDYMNELCILQDDVPPFPNQVAFNIIEEELGQPLEAVFSKISSETIAAASLGQVYRATLRASGEDVAIKALVDSGLGGYDFVSASVTLHCLLAMVKAQSPSLGIQVQRPEIEPIIYRDLFLFRNLASLLNGISLQKLGCNAELIVDEFGEKLLEELDYTLEARNIEDFLENFKNDPTVKIPGVYKQLCGSRVLVMEWIDGIRCTDPQAIKDAGIDVNGFLTIGVSAALRQLLEFGFFHGDPHPGNIFAMRDGRIAYVDFGNVAVLSQALVDSGLGGYDFVSASVTLHCLLAMVKAQSPSLGIQVQRPEIEPIIYRDLFLFRNLASLLNGISLQKLGCNAELIVDEFGEKLLEELDYTLEARNIEDFLENFKNDPTVKIPGVYKQLCGSRVLVMEWIDGIRCTDPQAIKDAGIDVNGFLTIGVSAALRQLLEFGFFHGDPHPGNIFAMRDGRIAYVDFGNVAVLSQQNKQILIDAVVHAVNEDYVEMANDFTRLGFLASGTDVSPIIPALEAIWQNSVGKGLSDFNFRSVTGKFNQLVYQYPIRIPERFSLVIRSLLTQEGICFTMKPDFKFLEVAYPYVAKRLLTDPNPALRERLIQVLLSDNATCEGGCEVKSHTAWIYHLLPGISCFPGLIPFYLIDDQSYDVYASIPAEVFPLPHASAPTLTQSAPTLTQSAPPIQEQVLFKDGVFQWKRLENLIVLAKENVAKMSSNPALKVNNTQTSRDWQVDRKLDLTDTIKDGARLFLVDEGIRRQLLLALTEDSKLHIQEIYHLLPGISCFPGLIPFYLIDDQSYDVYASISSLILLGAPKLV